MTCYVSIVLLVESDYKCSWVALPFAALGEHEQLGAVLKMES